MTDYITASNLKKSVSLEGEVYADEDINRAISTASAIVDQIAGPFPVAGTADTVRYYTPDVDGTMTIDPLVELTSLEAEYSGGTAYADVFTVDADFKLLPLNAEQDGLPWTSVKLNRSGGFWRLPQAFPAGVRITGRFGYESVPAGVETATTILSARLLARQRSAPLGVIDIGPDGSVVRLAREDPDVMAALSPFMRRVLFV